MCLPPSPAPPVKVIFAMSGWATSAAPTSGPEAGDDVEDARRQQRVGHNPGHSTTLGAANSDGLRTTVLPAAKAGATLCASEIIGEFQGIIAAITPSGSLTVETRISGPRAASFRRGGRTKPA